MALKPTQKGWMKRQKKALDLFQEFRNKGHGTSLSVAMVADRMDYALSTVYLIIKKAKENGTITD